MTVERPDMRWQKNTCPICGRTFQVTPSDDYLIPACGCYDDAEPGHYPCEACGIAHMYEHKGRPAPPRIDAIVDADNRLIASAGPDPEQRRALLGEFFVEPERKEDEK